MLKERVSQEKGLARIQQLMEMFPEIPRQGVIRADHLTEGLRHTADLDEIGRWAWPDAHDHYEQDYDEHSQGDLAGGVSRTPKQMYFGEDQEQPLLLDSRSPYEVKYEGGGRYWLYRDGEPIEEVYFIPCPQWFWKKTSSGKPLNQVITANFERTFGVFVTTYCEYFKDGNQCLFCNLNTTADIFGKLGQEKLRAKREQDLYEAYMTYAQEQGKRGIQEIRLYGGSFYNRSKEAAMYLPILEVLKRAMRDSGYGCDLISIVTGAMEEADALRLKEAGATRADTHLEVWDPKMFEIVCPGKAKGVGRERWIECLLKEVEIFGWGNARCNFVIGTEMTPPFGFKTEEEAYESNMEGFRFLLSHGVSTSIAAFQPRPGAPLVQAPRPRSEYFLRLAVELEKLRKEHNLPMIPDHFC